MENINKIFKIKKESTQFSSSSRQSMEQTEDYAFKKNIDTQEGTIDADGTETIDGDLTQALINMEVMTLQSDGSNWWII